MTTGEQKHRDLVTNEGNLTIEIAHLFTESNRVWQLLAKESDIIFNHPEARVSRAYV